MYDKVVSGRGHISTLAVLTKKSVLKINLSAKYREEEETREVIVDKNGGKFEFTTQFCVLD